MSFSQTFDATSKKELVEKLDAYPAALEAQDRKWQGIAEGVVTGHQAQAKAGIEKIKQALADVADEQPLTVKAGVWGHADEKGQGTYGFQVQAAGLTAPSTE